MWPVIIIKGFSDYFFMNGRLSIILGHSPYPIGHTVTPVTVLDLYCFEKLRVIERPGLYCCIIIFGCIVFDVSVAWWTVNSPYSASMFAWVFWLFCLDSPGVTVVTLQHTDYPKYQLRSARIQVTTIFRQIIVFPFQMGSCYF